MTYEEALKAGGTDVTDHVAAAPVAPAQPAQAPAQSAQHGTPVNRGGFGPGSVSPESETDAIRARPIGLLEQAVKGSPGGRGYATEAEDAARREAMHAGNPIEHDPMAQMVVAAPLAAGAGALVAPALGPVAAFAPQARAGAYGCHRGGWPPPRSRAAIR